MNNFDSTWEDFCSCQAGICLTGNINFWQGEEGYWDNPVIGQQKLKTKIAVKTLQIN